MHTSTEKKRCRRRRTLDARGPGRGPGEELLDSGHDAAV